MKKVVVIAMVLGLVSIASAVDTYWNGGTGDWNTASNWDAGLPDASTSLGALVNADGSIVNVTGTGANAHRLFLGYAGTATQTLNVRGELTVPNAYSGCGKVAGPTGTINVNTGGNFVTKGISVGDAGVGTLNMYGGRLQVGVDAATVLKSGIAGAWQNAGTGTVNLYDGVLDMSLLGNLSGDDAKLRMATHASATATLNIAGGSLILPGNITDLRTQGVATLNAAGVHLQAYGVEYVGDTMFAYSFDGTNTTITAIPEPATIALLGLGGLALLRRKRS